MQLCYNASQILKETYLPYFWHPHCQLQHGSAANSMAFWSCPVLFKHPIDLLLSCPSQTKHQNLDLQYLKLKNREFHSSFSELKKKCMPPFLLFIWISKKTLKLGAWNAMEGRRAFSWHTSLLSAILILLATLAPLTGFHASKRRDTKIWVLECRLNSNYPVIITVFKFWRVQCIRLAICFLSCSFLWTPVGVIILMWHTTWHVLAYQGQAKSRLPGARPCLLGVDLYLSFINSSTVHMKFMRWCEYLASSNARNRELHLFY